MADANKTTTLPQTNPFGINIFPSSFKTQTSTQAIPDATTPNINPFDISRDIVRGGLDFGLSALEAPTRIAAGVGGLLGSESAREKSLAVNAPIKVPFIDDVQSFQSQQAQALNEGASPFGSVLGAGANTVINEPLGVAFKPAFLVGGLLFRQFAKKGAGSLIDEFSSFIAKTKDASAIQDKIAPVLTGTPDEIKAFSETLAGINDKEKAKEALISLLTKEEASPLGSQSVKVPLAPETGAGATEAAKVGETAPAASNAPLGGKPGEIAGIPTVPPTGALGGATKAGEVAGANSRVSINTELENLRQAVEATRDAVSNLPGKELVKFVSRSTGELPELRGSRTFTGTKITGRGKFATQGDQIFQDLVGQDVSKSGDVVEAQKLVEEYQNAKRRLTELEQTFKDAKVAARENKTLTELSDRVDRANEKLRMFQKTNPELFRATLPLSQEATRGAKIGFAVGSKVTRENILSKLRVSIQDTRGVKNQIIEHAKNLPQDERGKLLTLVRDAKTQKDLTKAFVRIDNKVKEVELKQSITGLKDIADKLVESPAVSADYRNKIKDIIGQYELTGHTNATIAKLEATQAFIDRTKGTGVESVIPNRILNRLKILARTPKSELTLQRVQGLQAEIERLAQLGKTKWRTKQALYEGQKEFRKNELLTQATPINSKDLGTREVGASPNVFAEKYIGLRNYLQKTRVGLTPIEGLADITGMQPLKVQMDNSYGAYLDRAVEGVDDFGKLESDFLELGHALSDGERERVGVFGARVQVDGYEKLANLGITREAANAVVLTEKEQAFYDAIQKFNKATYESVKKYALDVYNADIGKVENYMSFQTDFNAMSDLEMFDRFGSRVDSALENAKTKTVEQGFTKVRTGAGGQKIQLDALKVAQRHADDVAYMLTMGRDIKQYSEILNNPEMRQKLGDVGSLAWLQWLDMMARKGGSAGAKRIAWLDIARRNLGAGVLGFRISSALVQFTSFADNIATIGVEHAAKGASAIASSREWRDFIMDNFPEVRAAVGDDIAFRELASGTLGKLQQKGLVPLQTLDGLMRSTSAAGAYIKLAEKAGKVVDLTKPDKELIQMATKLMRQSQGSSFGKDQPLALTTGFGLSNNISTNKAILTFQSFMLARWDNIQRQIWRLGIQQKDYKKAAAGVFWMAIVASAMEEGIRRGVRSGINFITGDDQPEQSFAQNAALNLVQTVPIMGQTVSSLTYSSNPVPVLNAIDDAGSGLSSVVKGKAINTKARGAVQTAGALGSLFGIAGSSQAAQIARKAIPKANSGGNSVVPGLNIKIPDIRSAPQIKIPAIKI